MSIANVENAAYLVANGHVKSRSDMFIGRVVYGTYRMDFTLRSPSKTLPDVTLLLPTISHLNHQFV